MARFGIMMLNLSVLLQYSYSVLLSTISCVSKSKILFAGYELSQSQPETENSKSYSDILPEGYEFPETTKSEQSSKYMREETESANSKNEVSQTGLFDIKVPNQDSYSNAENQEDSMSLSQSINKPQDVHVPIPVVPKQANLETAVLPVTNVRTTTVEMKRKQTVCIRLKKSEIIWV
jgi:hypothetical protein